MSGPVTAPARRWELSLRFRILGPLEVIAEDGHAVDLGGPKQRAVLALLCINANRVVALDELIDQMWGDEPPARAAATIQAYVSNLRRLLDPDRQPRAPSQVIVSQAPGYALVVRPDQLDSADFVRLVDEARALTTEQPDVARRLLTEALGLWRGPALADFVYQSFATTEITRLTELRISALEERIQLDLELGDHTTVVPELEQLVERHPLRERVWAQLMVALYRSGRQADALRAYQRFRQVLGEELGLDPGPDLQRLEEAILTHDSSLSIPARSRPQVDVTAAARPRPVLDADAIGRQAEIDAFRTALERAATGRGSLLLISGEPGIGKTRLLEAMIDAARAAGVPAGLGRCFEVGATPPFWPWGQASRMVMDQLGVEHVTRATGAFARELAPLLPDLRPHRGRPPMPLQVGPHRVAEGFLHAMRVLTSDQPLVMAIDDLYGSDPDSLTVLTLLAHSLHEIGVVLVCSYRTVDTPQDHPLDEVLSRVSRLDATVRLTLKPLDVSQVADLVHHATGRVMDPDAAEAIHTRTGGNAFYIVELARLLAAEGNLSAEVASRSELVPDSVRDVLRRRLARLPEETVQVLRVAAASGRHFDLDVVADVVGVSPERALDLMDLAIASGLVVEAETVGQFRFTHVLVRDAVAAALNTLRLARIHQQIGDALHRIHGTESARLPDIAFHAVKAVPVTGAGQAIPHLRRAAADATAAGALERAEELHRVTLDLVAQLPASPLRDDAERVTLVALESLVTLTDGYQSERLRPIHTRLAEILAQAEPEMAAAVLTGRWAFHAVRGELDQAQDMHAELTQVAIADGGPLLRMMAHHTGGILEVHRGRVHAALRAFAECELLLAEVDPDDSATVFYPGLDQAALIGHTNFLSIAQWLAGDTYAAWTTAERGVAAARRVGHDYSLAFSLTFSAFLAAMAQDVERATIAATEALSISESHHFSFLSAMAATAAGWAEVAGGDRGGLNRLEATHRQLDSGETGGFVTVSWGLVADGALRAGRHDWALDAIARGMAASVRSGEMLWRPELHRLRGMLHRLDSQHADADAEQAQAVDFAIDLGLDALRHRAVARNDPTLAQRTGA